MNNALSVELGQDVGTAVRDEKFDFPVLCADKISQMLDQHIKSLARVNGDEERLGVGVTEHRPRDGILDLVDLVEDGQGLLVIGAEVGEHLHRGAVEFEHAGMRGIEQVDKEVGHDGLLKRGIEGLHQLVGKLPDESNRVCQQEGLLVREIDFTRRRVECCEEGILDQDIRPSEAAKKRGFSGIGVADDGDIRNWCTLAVFTLVGAVAAYLHEVAFQAIHLASDLSFILLELALTLALGANSSTLFAKVAPGPGEPRQRIRHTGKVHLDLRLACLSPRAEDIENDLLTVDHRHLGQGLPVALLGGGQLIVEDDDIAPEFSRVLTDFLSLARAKKKSGLGFPDLYQLLPDDRHAERAHQLAQFVQEILRILTRLRNRMCAHQKGPLDHLIAGFDFEHKGDEEAVSGFGCGLLGAEVSGR